MAEEQEVKNNLIGSFADVYISLASELRLINGEFIINKNCSPNEILLIYSIYSKDINLFNSIKDSYHSIYNFKRSIKFIYDNYLNASEEIESNFTFDFNIVSVREGVSKIIEDYSFVFNEPIIDSNEAKPGNEDEFKTFCNSFYDLFPKGVYSGGYLIRSGLKDVNNKLKKFNKLYPEFSYEIVLKATSNYLSRYKLKNYQFVKTASYFISKDGNSTLAAECEAVINSSSKPAINNLGGQDMQII